MSEPIRTETNETNDNDGDALQTTATAVNFLSCESEIKEEKFAPHPQCNHAMILSGSVQHRQPARRNRATVQGQRTVKRRFWLFLEMLL